MFLIVKSLDAISALFIKVRSKLQKFHTLNSRDHATPPARRHTVPFINLPNLAAVKYINKRRLRWKKTVISD